MKNYILLLFCAALPLICSAQKITLGSCETKDGGTYQGEMASGKPHGKGKTVYKNGDTYEGEYVKGKRQTARMSDRVQGTCTVALTVLVPSPI